MKLFIWTESDYEACNHKIVFADTVEQSREMVVANIRESWATSPRDASEWSDDLCENEVQEFLTDTKWQVREYEFVPGVA